MGCGSCCRYFPWLQFTIGLFTFLAFLMGTISFISPAWLEREVEATDLGYAGYSTYQYGILSNGGVMEFNDTNLNRYVWNFKNHWNQWDMVEDKTIMIVFACGLLFLLISFTSITVTECVPIKNRSTMFIMMVIWDVLAALSIAASVIVFCATWHENKALLNLCSNAGGSPEFKAFNLGKCSLSWSLYGAVATACTTIFLTGLNVIASYQAKNQRRDAAFRHM